MKFKKTILSVVLLTSTAIAAAESSPIWTQWYHHSLLVGAFELLQMRNWLDAHALYDTTTRYPDNIVCAADRKSARSANGTCTDLENPGMGAAGVRFGRNVPLTALHAPTEQEIFDPSPREISRVLLTRDEFKPVGFLNMLAATWIQFMIHDWVSHGDNEMAKPMLLPLASGDPFGQGEMLIQRTQQDLTRTADDDRLVPLSFRNEVTHWWDGSQIYGSDQATQNKIRSFKDGKLTIAQDGLMPMDPADGLEITGFKRNWWLGLDMMHQLFVNEHNSIAERLKASHPDWDDQTLFDKSRLVNVAVMAKIHTIEWTPAILPNPILKQAMNANWYGVNSQGNHLKDFLKFIKDPVFNGIVGGRKDLHNVPYTLTEEFTSVYRLHSLLPEELDIRASEDHKPLAKLPLADIRNEQAHQALKKYSLTDLFYSLGTQHPGALTLHNYPRFLQQLDMPVVGKMDMGTIDLVRDRERGVPRYNEFRRLLNLNPITRFEDLTDDAESVAQMKRLYKGDVEKLDLMIGALAESHRPTGFGFGETQFQIFIAMATRRLQSDRFFTTDFTPEVYSQEGLDWVDQATFKSVLLRHYPGLAKHLEGIDNAFNPWN